MIIGGYEFKNSKMLDIALTHSSYSSNNYERLEFLGDSILDFLIADILYSNKSFKEDELTRARANIVSEEALCKVFDKLNIEKLVKLGKSCKILSKAIKGDIVESIIATIYLESGLNECRNFILSHFNLDAGQSKDFKTQFQEFAQKYKYNYEYVLEKTEGPAHNLTFYMSLVLNGEIVASAKASSKIECEKKCASIALNKFKDKIN